MRLLALFPTLATVSVPTGVDLDAIHNLSHPDSAVLALAVLQDVQDGAAPHLMGPLTERLLEDLVQIDSLSGAALAFLTAALCAAPAFAANRSRDAFTAQLWVHRAVGADASADTGTADWTVGSTAALAQDPLWGMLLVYALLDLAPLLFNLAAVHGHAAALAAELYPTVYQQFLREVAAGRGATSIDVAIDMLRWQVRRGHAQDAAVVARAMEQLLKADPSMPSAGQAAGMLATMDPHLTGLDRADFTAWALEHVDLDHNGRFAIRMALARISGPGWAQRSFAELRGAFEEVVEQIGDSFAKHERPRILGQLLGGTREVAFDLMRSGDHRLLWQWLGLCRGVDHGAVRDDPCLAIGWGGDRVWFRPDQPLSPATGRVAEFLGVLNRTLGSGVVAVGPVNTALTVPVSGRKNVAAAARFEEALEEFVDTADLARHARDSGAASIVSVLPGQFPVQALLARAGGPVLPYSVSTLPPGSEPDGQACPGLGRQRSRTGRGRGADPPPTARELRDRGGGGEWRRRDPGGVSGRVRGR
ncbi:hypothetical protein [Streptomyces hydrogenans]|uniref:hypothetical protein n=1 Tax=Streptomyces hydrogenans TaxID=1873719 RepID=UPI0035DEF06B